MSGPVIGAFFYDYVQYQGTFFGFAFIMFMCGMLAVFYLPQSLNRVNINASTSIDDDKDSNPYGISY